MSKPNDIDLNEPALRPELLGCLMRQPGNLYMARWLLRDADEAPVSGENIEKDSEQRLRADRAEF